MGEFDAEMAEARQKAVQRQKLYDAEQDREYAKHMGKAEQRKLPGTFTFAEVKNSAGEVTAFLVSYEGQKVGLVVKSARGWVALGAGANGDDGPTGAEVLLAFSLTGKMG